MLDLSSTRTHRLPWGNVLVALAPSLGIRKKRGKGEIDSGFPLGFRVHGARTNEWKETGRNGGVEAGHALTDDQRQKEKAFLIE